MADVPPEDIPQALPNNNPTGKNQYKECPSKDDPRVKDALMEYHRRGITDRVRISQLLLADHSITLSASSVARRRRDLKLYASGKTTKMLSETTKRQLVLDQMAQDPSRHTGPRALREAIALQEGVHLTRDYIHSEMLLHDPDGFNVREPTAQKVPRSALSTPGLHYEWSGDGHDKLSAIGFPIWGVKEKWCTKWLGLWVVPNNRLKQTIAYLYLNLIEELGGMPIQMTTDCGSETTRVFALGNMLREIFSPDLDPDEHPVHRFLKSVHNITIEKGWLQLRVKWGDNVKIYWEAGKGIYNASDPDQYELVQWLWPKLIQEELDRYRDKNNNHVVRFDKAKKLPSGTSPNIAYSLHAQYGVENYLQPVDKEVIRELKEALGGEDIIRFVSVEYAQRAEGIFSTLGIELSFDTVWMIFQMMQPLVL